MIARELAELLMENPDAEVIFERWDNEYNIMDYAKVGLSDSNVDIPRLYANDILNRPDSVFLLSEGDLINSGDFN
jgi:hypothetical protein